MTDAANATVVVADDEEALADLYADLLADEYEVRTAYGGEAALDAVDDGVDVVLLDRRMPDLSGDEVLSELRDRGLDCMVAILTAIDPDAGVVDMPFDDYEVKPVDRGDLLDLVERLLDRATYDERSREFFRLASKKAVLEAAGNDGTEEYERLVARLRSLRGEVDASLERIGAETAFGDLPGGEP